MRLPPELLDKIFALVSEDGGKTMCALRASSQEFRVIVEPYHLKTVLVTSVDSIWALCRTLRSIPEQRRIQTLHVRLEVMSAKPKSLKGKLRHLLSSSDHGESAPPSLLAKHAMISLCRLCASSLSTLALMVEGDFGPIFPYVWAFQGTTYPFIKTLIIGNIMNPSSEISCAQGYMPRLEQLYLGGCHDIRPWTRGRWGNVWGQTNIPHIHVQSSSNQHSLKTAHCCLSYNPDLDVSIPEVLHLWPMDGDSESWEELETLAARVPTAPKRREVRLVGSAATGLSLIGSSTGATGPSGEAAAVWRLGRTLRRQHEADVRDSGWAGLMLCVLVHPENASYYQKFDVYVGTALWSAYFISTTTIVRGTTTANLRSISTQHLRSDISRLC
jgi:hypothetical protein